MELPWKPGRKRLEASRPCGSSARSRACWLTLDRPAELNCLSPRLVAELGAALDDAERDSTINALVLTGAGRAFCAGADLKFVKSLPEAERERATAAFLDTATRTITRLARFRKPVIAAVNGIATAGGMELVLAADLVIAAKGAKLGDGHANYGLLPGAGGSVRLPRRIGSARAKYLFFTGELVPAETLVEAGLVNEVVEPDALEARVEALVEVIGQKSPLGLARMKEMADRGLEMSEDAALAFEQAIANLHTTSFDRNEGLAAFVERRAPRFEGC